MVESGSERISFPNAKIYLILTSLLIYYLCILECARNGKQFNWVQVCSMKFGGYRFHIINKLNYI